MLNENFCHLHIHDEYSLLDGCGSCGDYVEKAIEMGFEYLAITNHGNVDGLIRFQKACKDKDLKPIFGCELYIVPNALSKEKGEKKGHIVALVKNKEGWQNLLKMLTFANVEGFYKRPRIDYDCLMTYNEGLIFLTGCIGSFLHLKGGEDLLRNLAISNKGDVYIEIMPHNDPDNLQIKHNRLCKELAEKYNLPLAATIDAHYITEKDRKSQEVLLAIQTKKKWNDKDRFKFSFTELYLQDANEMIEGFLKQRIFDKPEIMSAMRNTIEIARKCANFTIEKLDVYLPQIPQCERMKKEEEIKFLKDLCEKGFEEKINKFSVTKNLNELNKYKERYSEEIDLIVELGFERYFLIVWELINWCKDNDIMCGPGRGCFLPDTKIIKNSSSKPIKNIKKGEYVFTHDRTYQKVIDKFKYTICEEIIELKLSNNRSIKCTKDHKIMTTNGYRPANDLKIGDKVLSPIRNLRTRKIKHNCEKCGKIRYISLEKYIKGINKICLSCASKKGNKTNGGNYWKIDENRNRMGNILKEYYKDESHLEKKRLENKKMWEEKGNTIRKKLKIINNKNHSIPELVEKMANKKIPFFSKKQNRTIICHSSLESKFLNILENRADIIAFKRCKMYTYWDKNKRYYPDFDIVYDDGKREIIEIKSNYWWNKKKQENMKKKKAFKAFIENNGIKANYKIIFEDDLLVMNDLLHNEIEIIDKRYFNYSGDVYDIKVDKVYNYVAEKITVHNSVGGCLVAYLLGITKVDPIEHGLLFSRFISPARIDLPDIDMDFEDIKRKEIRKHLEQVYGKNCVAGASTFSKMKGRGALRDVARVFDVPLSDVDLAAKSIIVRSGGDFRASFSIADAFETFEDGIKFKKKYPKVTEIAINLEGQAKNCGIHAAAMIVSKDDLTQGQRTYLKVDKKNGGFIVNWDKKDVEHVGLMKLDVLGLNALTILNATRKLIKENRGVDIDFESIPMDDKRIFDEFTEGNCIGIFQFGSLGLRKLCTDLKINTFRDLVDANALFRPGTLRSGMTNVYVARKNKQEEWTFDHPYLEDLTKDTYGIILYQEQIMKLMYELAGMGWRTADTVRKVIGKSQGVEQFMKFKDDFIAGCKKKKTLDEKSAGKLWDTLSSHGSYSFNLSHAVEYSMISYWEMWLKTRFPAEFIACSLSYGQDDKKPELVEEAKRIGLKIQLPKIGRSDSKIWKVKGDTLYAPFLEMKGIGTKTAEKIHQLDKIGFYEGEKEVRINKNIRELLDNIKAFDLDYELSEEEKEKFRDLFGFEISEDPMRKYKGIKALLENNIKINQLKDIDFKVIDKKKRYYFGQMIDIRFGYSHKMKEIMAKESDIAKVEENLGGVYGNIKDETDYQMVVFSSKIYNEKKYIIEHCGGEWALLECNVPSKSNNLICHNVWIGEELLKGNLDGLNIDLGEIKRFKGEGISNCKACDLRKTAKFPVPHSLGRYNAVIVGEAPGYDENLAGKGFIGKAGDVLWKKLKRYGLERWMFHVTNVCKCWPGRGNATPSISYVKICGQWLEKEIKGLKPFVILALGNTSLQFFKGEKAGITAMSGVTEWDDKRNCFICYCVHPAMLLHGRGEANELFAKGIKNFYEKIRILSKNIV